MSIADEFKKYRDLAERCRSCDPFSDPQEAAALLNLLAAFLDKLIAQKEAEREASRQTDIANLTAAILGMTEVFAVQKNDTANLTTAITDLTGTISVLTERVGNAAPSAKKSAPKKQTAQKAFVPPMVDEVSEYCKERKNGIDPQYFVDHYTARDWVLSNKNKMSDWKAAVRTWERNGINKKAEEKNDEHSYNLGLLAEHAMNTTPTLD